jgi:mono/diheme cytochrome c family protein
LTEVPEYLFERSKERRRALGLLSDDGGSSGGADAGSPASPALASPAAASPSPAAAITPHVEPPRQLSPAAVAGTSRDKVPLWILPVLFLLPIWGFTYVQLLEDDEVAAVTALSTGAQIFATNQCAGCHGGGGGGGVGYQLNNGEVLLTFSEIDPMLEWIASGTEQWGVGNVIGDPNREGGAHIAGDRAVMPGFGETLSESDIYAVSRFVREQFGAEELTAAETAARDLKWEELGGGVAGGGGGDHG